MFLYEFVIQCSSSTKRNIISAHLSFPRLRYDLNKNHTKAVSHGKNTATGVRKPGLQSGDCQLWGLKPVSLSEPWVSLWEVTQLQGCRCFCKWRGPFEHRADLRCDIEGRWDPLLFWTSDSENSETPTEEEAEDSVLCPCNLLCTGCGGNGLLRPDESARSLLWEGLEWPELTLLSFPNPTFSSSSFHVYKELACCSHLSCLDSLSQIRSFKIIWPDRLKETFTPLVRWLNPWHRQCVSTDACFCIFIF